MEKYIPRGKSDYMLPVDIDSTVPRFPILDVTEFEFQWLCDSEPDDEKVIDFLASRGIIGYTDAQVVVDGKPKGVFDVTERDFMIRSVELSQQLEASSVIGESAVSGLITMPDFGQIKVVEQGARTIEMDRIITGYSVDIAIQDADDAGLDPRVEALIAQEVFSPEVGIESGDNTFFFSPVFKQSGRRYSVAYVQDKNTKKMSPRLFYVSNSDGGWRSTPGFHDDGIISKGTFHGEEYGQYVQTTKPNESLVAVLDSLNKQDVPAIQREYLKHFFNADAAPIGNRFENEVQFSMVAGAGLDAYVSGSGYSKYGPEHGRAMLQNMQLPESFEPSFETDPLRSYGINHTLLGKSTVEVYGAELNNRPVEWHVAHDQAGRVWVDRLVYSDSKVTTSYGTEKEVILAGAINAKPLDYEEQTHGVEGIDYTMGNNKYADMALTIDRMPWAKRYRKGRNIQRQN